MKDTNTMTRLELEVELVAAREIIAGLRQTIERQNEVIKIYGNYIDDITNNKKSDNPVKTKVR